MKRRSFLKNATLVTGGLSTAPGAAASTVDDAGPLELQPGGRDFSPRTGRERARIPSACWQCVNVCAIVGHVEDGRVAKIEGHPDFRTNAGKLCARGQAGINQAYNPDRLLHPMVREGRRGEGRWRRVGWDEAMELLVEGGEIAGRPVRGLRSLREEGVPERFLFHYGRMVGSDMLLNLLYFCHAYGTGSIGNHNSICIQAGGVGNSLMGDTAPSGGLENARVIVLFGSSALEASFGYVRNIGAYTRALERGARLYVFDPRLSNTAAKGTEWIPLRPGTDQAVALALSHELVRTGLHDEAFVRRHTNISPEELASSLDSYTPEWAESVSTVPAETIRRIARELGEAETTVCATGRGAFMHHNGVQTERSVQMLRAVSGELSGPVVQRPRPRWDWAFPIPRPASPPRRLAVLNGEPGAYAFGRMGVSHQITRMIDQGLDRPELYLLHCHNPVYSNGHCEEVARVYRDEEKIPFLVASDVILSESSELADLVLPDATYLERWTLHEAISPEGVPEYYLRQPMHPPLGEARNLTDVLLEVAGRLDLGLGFDTVEEFVRATVDNTPGIREAGGFEYLRRHGIWHDETAEATTRERGEVTILSETLGTMGFDAFPHWMPVAAHQEMADDELVLITFKVPVQTHSRTQNCKWLTELFHENRAWINPATAERRGIRDGDAIRVRSEVGEIVTRAKVTPGIHPGAVAIANHGGHWAHGIYASGRQSPVHTGEVDVENRWWPSNGAHVNRIIPNRGEPISGSMCWMDTVVRVEPVSHREAE